MTGDYSWNHSAQVYLDLYRNLLGQADTIGGTEEKAEVDNGVFPEDPA